MVLTIAAALLIIPMAVFADTPKNDWNADRTIYYDASGNPTKGLFKAKMSDGVGAMPAMTERSSRNRARSPSAATKRDSFAARTLKATGVSDRSTMVRAIHTSSATTVKAR